MLRRLIMVVVFCYSSSLFADVLERRNPYNLENYIESDHFAIYWGSGIEASELQGALDALEIAWQELIINRGFQRPKTTNRYKLNLYVSQTGQPVLDDQEHAVQYWDVSDHEVIVFNKDQIRNDSFMKLTTAHEFFHAIQTSYMLPIDEFPTLFFLKNLNWTHEATASWAAQLVWPEFARNEAVNHLTTFAPFPQYSLDTVSAKDVSRPRLEFHRYGTYVFFNHLTEALPDADFVLKWFVKLQELAEAGVRNTSTLDEMKTLVFNQYNQSLEDLFAQFVAKNAVWDYPDGDIYREVLTEFTEFQLTQHIARGHSTVENRWFPSPIETTVHRWGGNYIKLTSPNLDNLEIGFEGNLLGSNGNSGKWHVTVVLNNDGVFEYIPLQLTDGKIQGTNIETINATEVWLAIAFTTTSNDESEIFAYRYQFSEVGQFQVSPNTEVPYPQLPQPPPQPNEDNKGGGGSIDFITGLLLLLLIRVVKY